MFLRKRKKDIYEISQTALSGVITKHVETENREEWGKFSLKWPK